MKKQKKTNIETDSLSEEVRTRRSPRKHYKANFAENSCVLCGASYINRGRILHGHCVCEDCVEYIVSAGSQEPGEDGESPEAQPAEETRLREDPDEPGPSYL